MKSNLEKQFLDLVKMHQDKIFRLCRAYLYEPNQAEDLYQEVLINIWKSLPQFKGTSAIATWVYRITVNTAISFNRKEKKNPIVGQDIPEHLTSDLEAGVQAKQAEENQMQQMHRAIAQLEPQDRVIIGLYLEDVAYKEIANIIGASTNLVGVKINRIKTKLTKILNPTI